MANVNKVILIGNLTRDPELRYLPSGTAVCEIGLATNRSYKNSQGEKQEEVTFVDIAFFGKQAELIKQYMGKGRPLYVEGRLKYDTWESKEGGKRSKLSVVGDNFQFLGDRSGSGSASSSRVADSAASEGAGSYAPANAGSFPPDDDIPF